MNKKIILTIAAAAGILIAGRWLMANNAIGEQAGKAAAENKEAVIPSPTLHPFSIEAIRQEKYQPETVKTIRVTADNPNFRSEIISFPVGQLTQYTLKSVPGGLAPEGGWPVVIVAHGYIDPKVYSTETSYAQVANFFVQQGFLVLKPDYRGHDKSEGNAGNLTSRIEYSRDVMSLMANVANMEEANENKIYLWGHSMGGDVSLRILETSDTVRAASLWSPVATQYPEAAFYFLRPGEAERMSRYQEEIDRLFTADDLKAAAPINHLKYIKAPILIQHAKTDEVVPFSWSEELDKRLTEENKIHEFVVYENGDHNLAQYWTAALTRDAEWFKAH